MAANKTPGREQVIHVRVTDWEYHQITSRAKSLGMTTSAYARATLMSESPQAQTQAFAAYTALDTQLAGVENAVAQARAFLNSKEQT